MDERLSLGVIFTGMIDPKLKAAMEALKGFATTSSFGAVTREATKTKAAVKGIHDETSQLGKRISSISGGFQRLTGAFKVVAAYGIAGTAVFKLVEAIKSGVSSVVEFDQSLYNLQAIISATNEETAIMGDKILDVAAKTKFSAKEVADAAILLGQSGQSATEVVQSLEAVANLATGTLSDMKMTSDLVTTALRAFQIDASQSAHVADVMANAVNKSKLTVDKLRIAFNYVSAVANKAGVSLEETAAAMMVLANSGIRASTIGTGLRQVFARLVAPSEKLREAYTALGIDIDKLNPRTNSLADIIERLTQIVPDATKAFQLFGLRGAPAVAALTALGREGFEEMYAYVMRTGSAAEMAAKQMEGLGVMLKNLGDKLGVLAIKIGDAGFTGALKGTIAALRAFVDLLIMAVGNPIGQWLVLWGQLIVTTYALATALRYLRNVWLSWAIGETLAITKGFISTFGAAEVVSLGWANTLTKLGAAIGGVSTALAVGGGAILAAIAAIITYGRYVDNTNVRIQKQRNELAQNITTFEDYEKRLIQARDNGQAYNNILVDMMKKHKGLAAEITQSAGNFEELLQVMRNFKAGMFYEDLELLGEQIKNLAKPGFFHDVANNVMLVHGLIESTDFTMGERANIDLEKLKDYAVEVAQHLQKIGTTAQDTQQQIEGAISRWIPNLPDKILKPLATFVKYWLELWDKMEKKVGDIKPMLEDVPEWFNEMVNNLDSSLKRGEFWQVYDRMLKQKASIIQVFKDLGDRIGDTTKEKAAMVASLVLKSMLEFPKLAYEGIKTDAEIWQKRMDIVNQYEKGALEVYDAEVENAHRTWKAQIMTAKAEGKRLYETHIQIHDRIKKAGDEYTKTVTEAQIKRDAALDASAAQRNELRLERKKTADEKLLDSDLAYFQARVRLATNAYEKEQALYDLENVRIVKWFEKLLTSVKLSYDERKWLTAQFEAWREAREKKHLGNLIKINQDAALDMLEQEELQNKIRAEQMIAASAGDVFAITKINRDILQADIATQKKILNLRRENWEEMLFITGAGSEEEIEAYNEYLKAKLKLLELNNKLIIDTTKRQNKALEKYSYEWYIREKRRLWDLGASWRELLDLRAEYLELGPESGGVFGPDMDNTWTGMFSGFKAAWARIQSEMKTTAQLVSGALQEIYSSTMSTVSDTIYSTVKGNFEDIDDLWRGLADSMLRTFSDMLAEMAMQWATQAFVQGMASWFGGGYSGVGTRGMTAQESHAARYNYHSGGVVGEEGRRFLPSFHSGGASRDEVIARLRKQEVVFTPGQMDALGKAMTGGGGLSINVPISLDDPTKQKRLADSLRTEIEATAKRVLRQQLQ